jgi:hypothetical protein
MTRHWTVALAVACCLAGGAGAQTFTPARDELVSAKVVTMDAAEAWASEFFSSEPNVGAYKIAEPGHVIVTSKAGAQVDVYLDSLVNRLSVRDARRSVVLADFEAKMHTALATATLASRPTPLLDNVMPIVRHRDFLKLVLKDAGKGEGAGADDAPVHHDLAGDVAVVLAYDTPKSLAVMTKKSLGLGGKSDEEAFALALGNLARRAAGLTWREDGKLRVAELDGTYESSLLLVDRVWDDLEKALGGAVAVAVPARDELYAGRADDPEVIAALRKRIEDDELDPYQVSGDVFVRKGGMWEILGQKP